MSPASSATPTGSRLRAWHSNPNSANTTPTLLDFRKSTGLLGIGSRVQGRTTKARRPNPAARGWCSPARGRTVSRHVSQGAFASWLMGARGTQRW